MRKNKIGGNQGRRRSVKYTRFLRNGDLFNIIETNGITIDYSKRARPLLISYIDVSYNKDAQAFNVVAKVNSPYIREIMDILN